ncbi:coat protein [Picorna-like virus AWando15]|uniref:coat protein n=1 Tax=Picorna-like virus AWando15 TaxID=1983535 RepID=UPI000A276B7A|nr:coat protein [Picorna-like virus AWando15]ARN61512.1 coat protein [Picorna-like virus AWando15]
MTENNLELFYQWFLKDPYSFKSCLDNDPETTAQTKQPTLITMRAESNITQEMKTGSIDSMENKENVMDVSGNDLATTKVGMSDYLNNGQECSRDINKFLERPIKIDQFSVTTGQVSKSYKLWDILSKNDRIRSKFEKFAYFQGDIEIMISVSGTPFHKGKILVSYQPYPLHNESLVAVQDRIDTDPNFRPIYLVYQSQARGAKVMDVKDNQPLRMTIPFISHKPMWRLFNTSAAVLGANAFDDFENSGTLYMYTINDISGVSSTPSDVSVIVYANFVNVKLGTLTGTHFIAESKMSSDDSKDETKTGPVQALASKTASFLETISVIPDIAPLTIPASMVASGIAGICSVFGWSKPILDEKRITVKPDGYCNGMVVSGTETAKVLGVDPKRSLEVSQGMFGDTKDELVLEYLINRLSYFHTFSWNVGTVPFTAPIFQCAVNPMITKKVSILQDFYANTPLSFVSNAFTYWRGDIEFTFEFVVSSYHRGKVAIVYEPNISQSALIGSDFQLNEQYVRIVDLQEAQTVSVCIPWASDRPWREIETDPSQIWYNTTGALASTLHKSSNGYIFVYPVNTLQSPDTSNIDVNVYIRGKNFHYSVPTEANLNVRRDGFSAQSLFTTEVTCVDLNESTADDKNIHVTNFGEKIASFRSLLKRYQYADDVNLLNFSLTYANAIIPIFPENPAPYGSNTSDPVNLFSYLRLAYLGMRGSMRHRVKFIEGNEQNTHLEHINVVLNGPTNLQLNMSVTSTNTYLPIPLLGGVTYLPNVNSAVEVDAPFYTVNLWVYSQPQDFVSPNPSDVMSASFSRSLTVSVPHAENPSGQDSLRVIDEIATGEDFNFHYFTGAPLFSNPI